MSPPWMPLYVADYLADTNHLSATEHGAYLLLIMHYWQKGSLPDDDRQLARIARLSDRAWSTSRAILSSFFSEGWRHPRVERELAKAVEKNERRVAAGKAGGFAAHRHGRTCSNEGSNAKSNALASSSQPHPEEETSLRSVAPAKPRKPKSTRTAMTEDAQPTPADREHAASVGMTTDVFRFEWQRYRDHHLKVGSTMASWPAAWRTWCANWLERGGRVQARAGPGQRTQSAAARAAMMHTDEPETPDDPRDFPRNGPAESPRAADPPRSGFAGPLSEQDAEAARRDALVYL